MYLTNNRSPLFLQLTKIIEDSSGIEDVKVIAEEAIDIANTNKNWAKKYSAGIKKILQEPVTDAGNVPVPSFIFFIIFCCLSWSIIG